MLAWLSSCWHTWPGYGFGPAALSLVLGCSCRQGHMPEGELATLLPIPPGALLNLYLLFLLFSFSCRVLPHLPFLVTSHASHFFCFSWLPCHIFLLFGHFSLFVFSSFLTLYNFLLLITSFPGSRNSTCLATCFSFPFFLFPQSMKDCILGPHMTVPANQAKALEACCRTIIVLQSLMRTIVTGLGVLGSNSIYLHLFYAF